MAHERRVFYMCLRVPEFDRSVPTGRHESVTVRTVFDSGNTTGMPVQDGDFFTRFGVPQAHRVVIRC